MLTYRLLAERGGVWLCVCVCVCICMCVCVSITALDTAECWIGNIGCMYHMYHLHLDMDTHKKVDEGIIFP